jgi:Xaa-Pro dipeptidase
MSEQYAEPSVTREGCQARQTRLADLLAENDFDGAVLTRRGQIFSLTGHWTRDVFQSLLFVSNEGKTILATPFPPRPPVFVTDTIVFPGAKLGTMIDDQFAGGLEALSPWISGLKRIGTDIPTAPLAGGKTSPKDVAPLLRKLRRTKLPDEIELIRRGIAGCETAYAVAKESIRPGLCEWEMYLTLHAAALAAVGEPIGELGNDFQSGTPGGPPRRRPMAEGELMPLDLSVVVRGYSSDVCRTFCVGTKPTAAQADAHQRVAEALAFVEKTVRPGVSCRRLYLDVAEMLRKSDWTFPHHLGHGIGLSAHEAPRLNPNWDDTFQEGDVFTAEPGLYGEDLRGGVRLENDYVVTADGVRSLCSFPLDF